MHTPPGVRGTVWPSTHFRNSYQHIVTVPANDQVLGTPLNVGFGSGMILIVRETGSMTDPVRVRIYSNTDYQADDAARAIGVDPTGDHGVLLDVVLDGTEDTPWELNLAPAAYYYQDSQSGSLAITVDNLGDAEADLVVNLSIIPIEGED
jgi:hypothetical protein